MLDLPSVPTTTKGKQKGRILPLFYRMNTLSASHQSQRRPRSLWTTELCSKEPWQEQRLACKAIPPRIWQTSPHPSLHVVTDGGVATAALLMKFRAVSEGLWHLGRAACRFLYRSMIESQGRCSLLCHFYWLCTAPRPISTATPRFVSQQHPCPASIFEQIRASPAVLRALVCPPSTHLWGSDVVVQVRQLQHPAEGRRHRRLAAVKRGSRREGRELRRCRKSHTAVKRGALSWNVLGSARAWSRAGSALEMSSVLRRTEFCFQEWIKWCNDCLRLLIGPWCCLDGVSWAHKALTWPCKFWHVAS